MGGSLVFDIFAGTVVCTGATAKIRDASYTEDPEDRESVMGKLLDSTRRAREVYNTKGAPLNNVGCDVCAIYKVLTLNFYFFAGLGFSGAEFRAITYIRPHRKLICM